MSHLILEGLKKVLPLTLVVTFILVPSTSTRIFKSFLCDSIVETDGVAPRRYLADDLALDCLSGEYDGTRNTAIVLIVCWTVG
eukprot:5170907-Prymnesium_polylepis.1